MNSARHYIYICLCFIGLYTLHAQNSSPKVTLLQVLEDISEEHSITFNYESNLLKTITVTPLAPQLSLSEKIKNLEQQTRLIFEKISERVYTIYERISLCGYIKDEEFQNPLFGATVTSESEYAITNSDGYFEMELKSLNDLITIRHIGFKTIKREANQFNLQDCTAILMQIHQEDIAPVLIETYLVKGIDKREDWSTSIDYSQFSLLPGLIETDVLQTVQALPSILSVDETVSNINIRGGSNDQNLILWDNIKMYQTGHFFGLISSFNPLMTQSAHVINNGSDVTLTDGVSGTIHMQTNTQVDQEFNGVFGLNFLNAELFSNIPIGSKSSLQIAGRKSINDFTGTPTYDAYFNRVTQDTEAETNSNQEFDFYDTALRWLYKPSDRDRIRLNFIIINNDLGFDETATINGLLSSKRSSISQNSIAVGINYNKAWSDTFKSILDIYETDYKLSATNADVVNNQVQLQENVVSETSIKLDNRLDLKQWRLNVGYQFTETEVINLNDIDLPRLVRRDEEVLREHATFAQAWYRTTNFSIKGGVRANYLTPFETIIVEPRLNIRQSIGTHIEIEVQGEFKHQSTSQIVNFQNDFLGIEKRRWQLTDNDSIPILKSKQASIGLLYKRKSWLVDAKAYYKVVDGITTQSQSFTTKYEFAKEKGQYDVFGLELLCRKQFKNITSWLSYAFMNNTYSFETLEDDVFPSNFDISHSVTLGSTFSNKNWNISAGLNYRIGNPTSIPLTENDILDNTVNFDKANNERLEDYLRIDASAIYKFKISDTFRSEVGASVWNVSDRQNAINDYYRVNDANTVNKFSRFSLGLTTNAVLRIYF